MRRKLIGTWLFMAATHALANDCVVGSEVANLRPDSVHAISSVFSVEIYSDIKSCNEAVSYQAQHLPQTEAAKSYPWDSLTFDCHVPKACNPLDAGEVLPFSRVVYIHYKRATVGDTGKSTSQR